MTKPTLKQALARADKLRAELPSIVQVVRSDWDTIVLASEVRRLQEYEFMYKSLCK